MNMCRKCMAKGIESGVIAESCGIMISHDTVMHAEKCARMGLSCWIMATVMATVMATD